MNHGTLLRIIAVLFFTVVFTAVWGQALANPFTTKPGKAPGEAPAHVRQQSPPAPVKKPGIMPVLINWQQQLREKMSALVREFRETGNFLPVLMLLGAGFLYGVVHSAGPGHGKTIALSYILAVKPGLFKAMAFGNILAFTHGLSGILLVLGVKFIFHTGLSGSLADVTHTTQVVSFSLILLLGLFLSAKSVRTRMKRKHPEPEAQPPAPQTILSAVAIGLIPCPGVVMVMIFALSLGLPLVGVAMGLAISAGMALTLSGVTLAGFFGKSALLNALSGRAAVLEAVETGLETLAGLAVTLLGAILLLSLF